MKLNLIRSFFVQVWSWLEKDWRFCGIKDGDPGLNHMCWLCRFRFLLSFWSVLYFTDYIHLQIRSHAQKYFLKVQKNGTSAHVPPPRPKRKASHPYPQKASKFGLAILTKYDDICYCALKFPSWHSAMLCLNYFSFIATPSIHGLPFINEYLYTGICSMGWNFNVHNLRNKKNHAIARWAC